MKHNLRFIAFVGGALVTALIVVLVLTSGWFQGTGTRSPGDGLGASSALHDASAPNPDVVAFDANNGASPPVSVQQQTNPNASLDELYGNVDQKAPGFGGMFYDDQGRLNVYVQDPAQQANAETAIAAEFGADRIPPAGIKVLTGQYAYSQLNDWYSRLSPDVLAIDGVILTDVDEAANRLRVGVKSSDLTSEVQQHVTALGIPQDAVVIEQTDPVVVATTAGNTLRDRTRPLVGGLQIQFEDPATGNSFCTLGFLAKMGNQTGFVTNSHCTGTRGAAENGTVIYQPKVDAANRVGAEKRDPNFVQDALCPPTRQCRYSDSAFIQLDNAADANLGFIAKPNAMGSLNIQKNFRIVEVKTQPIQGQILEKVGRTTGASEGPVLHTCTNFTVGTDKGADSGITMLCQDEAAYSSAGGDSGSPVFGITNSPNQNDVRLYGIHWGGNGKTAKFSNMGQIQKAGELGPLNVVAPGVTPVPKPATAPVQQELTFYNNTNSVADELRVVFRSPVDSAKVISQQKGCPARVPALAGNTVTVGWGEKCVKPSGRVWQATVPVTFPAGDSLAIQTLGADGAPFKVDDVKARVSSCDANALEQAIQKAPPIQTFWNITYADKCVRAGSVVTVELESAQPVAQVFVVVANGAAIMGTFSTEMVGVKLGITAGTKPIEVQSATWRNGGVDIVPPDAPKKDQFFDLPYVPNNNADVADGLRVQFSNSLNLLVSSRSRQPAACTLRAPPNGVVFSSTDLPNDTLTFNWTSKCVRPGGQVTIVVRSTTKPLKVRAMTWMNGGNAIQKRFRIENGSTGTASDVHIVFSAPVSAPKLTYQPEGCGGVYPNPTLTTTYVAGDTVNITWPEKCVKKAADRKAGEAQSWEGRVPVEFTTGPGNRLRISTNYLGNNPTVTDVKVSVDTCAGGQVLQATRKLPVDPYYGYWDITYNEKCIFIGSFMTAQIVSDPKGPEVPRVIAWVCNDNNCEIGARDLLESYLIRLGLFSDANGVKIRSITWTNQGNAIPTQAPGPPKDQSFTFFNNTKQKASGLKVVFSGQLLKTGIPVGPQGVYVGIGLGQQSVCNSPTTTPTPTPAVSTTNVDNDTVEITWPQKCIATGATSWEGIVPANFAQSGNRVRIYEYTDNPTLRPFRWNNVRVSVSTCDNGAFKKAVRKAPVGQFGENYWDVASYGTKCIRPGVSRIKAVIESKPGGGDARAVIRNDTTGYEAVFGLQNMGPIMPEQVSISVISRTNPLKVRQVTWMNAGNPIPITTPYTPTAKPTVTPTRTPTATPPTPRPPVGGIFRNPAVRAAPLEAQPSSSSDAWLLTAVAAIAVAGAITLGGGAWYGRRRKSVR